MSAVYRLPAGRATVRVRAPIRVPGSGLPQRDGTGPRCLGGTGGADDYHGPHPHAVCAQSLPSAKLYRNTMRDASRARQRVRPLPAYSQLRDARGMLYRTRFPLLGLRVGVFPPKTS